MKELKSETKAKAGQTHTKAKSDFQKSARYEVQETGYLTPEFQPPGRFAPLLGKLSLPANATLRVQFLTQLQQTYGNRYVQRAVSASRSQNVEKDESKLVSEILSQKGAGRSLQPEVKQFMEPRFGYDFSNVRLHTDSFAAKTAQDLGAEAFTIGKDVFFGTGRYNPESIEGKKLIAHELTHVVQQGGELHNKSRKSIISLPKDTVEREADHIADKVMSGDYASLRGMTSPLLIQRQVEERKEERVAEAKVADKVAIKDTVSAKGKTIGKIEKTRYKRVDEPDVGGLNIKLGYKITDNAAEAAAGFDSYRWIQVIYTNVPLGGGSLRYVDPRPADDLRPFYWTNAEIAAYSNVGGYRLKFSDAPRRRKADVTAAKPRTWWQAALSLVGVKAGKSDTILNILKYGFDITAAGVFAAKLRAGELSKEAKERIKKEFPGYAVK